MPKTSGPIRRGQLITPFGVGAMLVAKSGISLITAGLDNWFKTATGSGKIDRDEFTIQEWRLEERLHTDHFCLPPDFRKPMPGQQTPNAYLTIPFFRFPQWHFCQSCRSLEHLPLDRSGRAFCFDCHSRTKKKRTLVQVPFVAMCAGGHLQDFPWHEWVHRNLNPQCSGKLLLKSMGGASLASQQVSCTCGKQRTLAGITTAQVDGETILSTTLDSGGALFACKGSTPWLGAEADTGCGLPLRGSLRNAGNVYYGQSTSAIYLPRESTVVPTRLLEILMSPGPAAVLRFTQEGDPVVRYLRNKYKEEFREFSDHQVEKGVAIILNTRKAATASEEATDSDLDEASFRMHEFRILSGAKNEEDLVINPLDLEELNPDMREFFSAVSLVEKLRETRVFTGFTRVYAESGQSLWDRKRLLWAEPPRGRNSWLPAYVVHGEGIFLQLSEKAVGVWERQPAVAKRYGHLADQFEGVQQTRKLRERVISPRFVLVHTLAHLLIARLTFECGYSSASLKERLYVSDDVSNPMAGILIYTADGDADGTMGGLVRMGKPANLEPVLRRALENATWCSADPVCMESGSHGGQGPDSLNLAACHACALVPETACEEFNRFLDRAAVVGSIDSPDDGLFSKVASAFIS